MNANANALLEGPRGRHLSLAVAHRLHQPVWAAWLEAAWHTQDSERHAALVQTIRQTDPSPVTTWLDPLTFVAAMDEAVSSGMGWQPPHDEDVVAAAADVIEALQAIADAIAAAPVTRWWQDAIDLDALRYTARYDAQFPATPPQLVGAADMLAAWKDKQTEEDRRARAERANDPARNYSGTWWSTPAGVGLPTTTRPLPGLGSVKLVWEEDSFGQHDALIWALQPTTPPRVYEIDSPDAWIRLVRRYPLDVSWSRRHDWYRVTGHDGSWLIPDWEAVAVDWDAVHLTVTGYLQTATRRLPLDRTTSTLLAGWDPDQTWWLTDILTSPQPEPERWNSPASSEWGWTRIRDGGAL